MNGKERLTSILNGCSPDRLAWTMLIDETTKKGMKPEHRSLSIMDLYRLSGCDLMPFGTNQNPGKIVFPKADIVFQTEKSVLTKNIVMEKGILTAEYRDGHPIKMPVTTKKELLLYLDLWESAEVLFDQGSIVADNQMKILLKDDGVCVCTTQPSPVQHLLQTEMGIESFYYFLDDETELIERLLNTMHERYCEMYILNAKHSAWDVHIPVENTSTSYISPSIYEKYSLPHLSKYIEILHNENKIAIVHMCGLLHDLLPYFKKTGMDGIHAVTEAPMGDVCFDQVYQQMGDETILIGLMRGYSLTNPSSTRQEIWRSLDEIYTEKIRNSNFILCAAADGVPLPMDNFFYVHEWFEKYGKM